MTTATITSNGLPIPHTPRYFGELTASDLSLDAETLRARYKRDGYVLLRGAVLPGGVMDMRDAYLRRFPSGFLKRGDARGGYFTGEMPAGVPPHGLKGHPAHDFVRTDTFRAFAAQPKLEKIAEIFFGGPAERIKRTPLRHFIPGRNVA